MGDSESGPAPEAAQAAAQAAPPNPVPTPAPAPTNGSQPKDKRPRASKALPTDRIKREKQFDILRADAIASGPEYKPVNNVQVGQIVQLTASTVSMANPFLTENGFLIRGDGGYLPAPEVLEFSRAHQWNADTAGLKLAPLVGRAWFWQRLMPLLRFRALKEEEALVQLADAAAASPHHKTQLRVLLDYLELAGLINRENGHVKMGDNEPAETSEPEKREEDVPPPPPIQNSAPPVVPPAHNPPPATQAAMFSAMAGGGVQFDFSIKVSMAELAGWQPDRIAAFFGGLAQVIAAKGKAGEDETS